jgi:hypothetical protein
METFIETTIIIAIWELGKFIIYKLQYKKLKIKSSTFTIRRDDKETEEKIRNLYE